MTCREQILIIVKGLIKQKNKNEFTIVEVIEQMRQQGSIFKDSTIRTHITSRCCANVSQHHHVTYYDDYVRIGKGLYALNKKN